MEDKTVKEQAEISNLIPDIQIPPQSYQQVVLNEQPVKTMDFTLNMPEVLPAIDKEKKIDSTTSIYEKMLGGVGYVAQNVWNGIEYLRYLTINPSIGVSDFLGITAPRYELWMEDSIKYQQELQRNDPILDIQNSNILKEIQAGDPRHLIPSTLVVFPSPNTKMLKIPFKRAEPVAFQRALKEAISATFEEDPAAYQQDLETLESLRLSVQDPQVHEASLKTHLVYYAQLTFLESKFNISEDGVKLFFTWCNAFGKQDAVSSHNIGFEKASVLFNIGAIYCQLGVSTGAQSEEAIKKSALYFQHSAGAYKTIIDKLPSWNIQGAANTQLDALANLMLGQAQEVFLNKAIGSKMKESTLAKLAIQTSAFYETAYEVGKDTTVFDKAWLAHMNAKHLHFKSVCNFYKSFESEATGKFGEQVGWLAAALAANKLAKDQIAAQKLVVNALELEIQSFGSTLDTQFQRANKDNDKIYMESVPKILDLPVVAPARMVNHIPVPEVDKIQVPNPVFRALVPFQIHQAASKYDHKKDELVKGLSMKLTEATALAHTSLISQKLPGSIEALEQPIGLPSIVLERSKEVISKGGTRYIENSWAKLSSLSHRDSRLLQEKATESLDQEEREDEEMRRLYGARWNRAQSAVLTRVLREKGAEYKQKIESANQSNDVVRKKIDTNLFLIEHLTMDRQELEASIPASTSSSTLALKDPNLKLLKGYLDSLNKNIKQRPDVLARLKKISDGDDIGPRLTRCALESLNLDESALFQEQLKLYDPEIQIINNLLSEQEKLLETTNSAFMNSHQTNDLIRQREGALSNLEIAYKHFNDISGNLEEGIKFFTELEDVIKKFQSHCSDFIKARNFDRDQLLSQIQTGPSSGISTSGLYSAPMPQNAHFQSSNYHQQQYNPAALPNPQYYPQTQPVQTAPGIWNPHQPQGNVPTLQNPTNQLYPGTFNSNPPPNWRPPKY